MENTDRALAPVLELERAVPTTLPRAMPMTLALGSGVHALVGAPESGVSVLAPLVAGIARVRMGSVRVLGCDPSSTPAIRARIGATFSQPILPTGRTVADVVDLVRSVRPRVASGTSAGRTVPASVGAPPENSLQQFNLQHWANRRFRALSEAELRVLELVFAMSTPAPAVLVLTEPGLAADTLHRDMLRRGFSLAAEQGASVVVATASIQDGLDLAQVVHLFEDGRIVRSVSCGGSMDLVPGCAVELRVDAEPVRDLVERLAQDPAIIGLEWGNGGTPAPARPGVFGRVSGESPGAGSVGTSPAQSLTTMLTIRGNDLDKLASALARAVVAANGKVRSIVPVTPGFDEVRAASAGLALAAYHAAYAAYTAYAAPWVEAARQRGQADHAAGLHANAVQGPPFTSAVPPPASASPAPSGQPIPGAPPASASPAPSGQPIPGAPPASPPSGGAAAAPDVVTPPGPPSGPGTGRAGGSGAGQ